MSFIGLELILIVVARIFSVLSVQYIFVLFGAQKSLKFKECVFLSYAGMIRGAIALGLAIKAEHYFSEYEFVVASVLALVIISTLLFGSFMPLVAKCLLDPPAKATHNYHQLLANQQNAQTSFDHGSQHEGLNLKNSESDQNRKTTSSYSAMLHPNADPSVLSHDGGPKNHNQDGHERLLETQDSAKNDEA